MSSKISIQTFIIFTALALFKTTQSHPAQKETNLHLYFHETFTGPNATTVTAATQNSTLTSFGDIYVIDDYLRVGPDPTSKLIGYAQGVNVQASRSEPGFMLQMNWVFSEGEHEGSSLAVFGRATLSQRSRELTVVGGTGKFRVARGYVAGDLLDSEGGMLVIEYRVKVFHF